MKAEVAAVPVGRIEKSIFMIRGQRVMLDRDLARLYGVQTRVLNQAVSRNVKRFPSDFMFQLSREEILSISQIVTSSRIKFSKRVHAFTEQGVAMLSTVLNSERAIEVNIAIMRVFVRLRQRGQPTGSLPSSYRNWKAGFRNTTSTFLPFSKQSSSSWPLRKHRESG